MRIGDTVIPKNYGNTNNYKEILVTAINGSKHFSGTITLIDFTDFEQVVGFKTDAWLKDCFIEKPSDLIKRKVSVEITTKKIITVYGIPENIATVTGIAAANLGNFKIIKIEEQK